MIFLVQVYTFYMNTTCIYVSFLFVEDLNDQNMNKVAKEVGRGLLSQGPLSNLMDVRNYLCTGHDAQKVMIWQRRIKTQTFA